MFMKYDKILKNSSRRGCSIDSMESRIKYVGLAPRDYKYAERARLEFRTVRPQQSMDEWILELKFLDRFIASSKDATIDFDPFQDLENSPAKILKKFADLLLKLNLQLGDYDFMIRKSRIRSWSSIKSNSNEPNADIYFS